MITLTADQLLKIMPLAKGKVSVFLGHLNMAMPEFGIANSIPRGASFLATIGHESAQLNCVEEKLNYSVDRLVRTWAKRFPTVGAAAPYARNPQALANHVYANRGGNGNEQSGDGWRYRGAGLIQLTFKENQAACAHYFGIPVEQIGDWLRTPIGATRSAAWFWATKGLNEIADTGDQAAVCKRVNGGLNGLAERVSMFRIAEQVLSCSA